MLKIKDNCLCYEGISFSFPTGLYIDTNTDIVYQNGFLFKSKDESYSISLEYYDYLEEPKDYLISVLKSLNPTIIYKPINKFDKNGLRGAYTIYRAKCKEYYEAHFESVTKKTNIHFSIIIITNNDEIQINDVLNKKEVKKFLSNIKLDT